MIGIIKVKNVNLAQVALGIDSKAKKESRYRRMQRLLHTYKFDQGVIFKVVEAIFPLPRKLIVIMDRTNWQLGKAHINFFVVSLACRGIAIPIFWINLARAGNSVTQERIEVIARVINLIGKKRIKCLLADREFVGKAWFNWLIENEIRFLIREKKDTLVQVSGQKFLVPLESLFRRLKPCGKKLIKGAVQMGNNRLYIAGSRAPNGELLILASPKKWKNPLGLYKIRWEIETLFGCLKKRGFCLEETKITSPERVEKLFFVLAIAFCWALVTGIERASRKAIRQIKSRFEYSLFRYGYDLLREVMLNIELNPLEFRQLIKPFHTKKRWRICYA